jgi:hypothetical protein
MKLNIILDLDNTIVNTLPIEKAQDFMNNFHYSFYKNFFYSDVMIARPGLDEFLDWLFSNCRVSVFTHADKEYALAVINNLLLQGKKNRKLDFIYYRYHVNMGLELYNGYKDLRLIWDDYKVFDYYPSNTIIIDDNPIVKQTNPYNTIRIYPFDASQDSINDNHLEDVRRYIEKLILLYNKDTQNKVDIRVPILKKYGGSENIY